jgi:hypothetical protein
MSSDIVSLSNRVIRNLRQVTPTLDDASVVLHEELESVNRVRALLAEWALEAKGYRVPDS